MLFHSMCADCYNEASGNNIDSIGCYIGHYGGQYYSVVLSMHSCML